MPSLRTGHGLSMKVLRSDFLPDSMIVNRHLISRSYFTNTDAMNRDDPYHQLGLQWGDGATTAEIKAAFKKKAAQLHPDVNKTDSPAKAQRKFQELLKAYQTLLGLHDNLAGASTEKDEEWKFSIWRKGDQIALDRTDVAGMKRQRPQPAAKQSEHPKFVLGHPGGGGASTRRPRGEFLGDGQTKSSSVGRGLNKWVRRKEFQPWNGNAAKRASDFRQVEGPTVPKGEDF